MRWTKWDWVIVGCLLVMAGGVFFTGIMWGLPSRSVDAYLFGEHRVWTGAEILKLAPEVGGEDRGADVDANPIVDRTHAVLLNETDSQRAEIVRRYRLFSYQPDEMITFKALAGMRPGRGDLDPRLYQYGGLWVYPVGAMLKVASLVHLVDVRADKAWYLDHPEQFGRFYVVARGYSAMWGMAGAVVVYFLVRRMTASRVMAGMAGSFFVWMPAVINGAHEAKPHLAGAVLMLMAVAAGGRYIEVGGRKWLAMAGGLCGAALGMVLSGLLAFVILPVMVVLRPATWRERFWNLVVATAWGAGVYVVTNPYVIYNGLFRRARLVSNLGNSTAMYAVRGSANAVVNAIQLVAEGASVVVAVVGVIGVILLIVRALLRKEEGGKVGWLLTILVGVVGVQFVLLAGGKPGEYGRFALLVDVGLMMAGVVAASRMRPNVRGVLLGLLVGVVLFGNEYLTAFRRDARPVTSRLLAAGQLAALPGAIGLRDEPAPYLMPPVNLFERNLVLMPRGEGKVDGVDFVLTPVDEGVGDKAVVVPTRYHGGGARISWADKRFELVVVRWFLTAGDVTRRGLVDSGPR